MLLLLLLLMWNDIEGAHGMQGCGPEKVNYTKPLTSPEFPENYPNDMDCNYTVHIPANMGITIMLNYFKLESGGECSFDYLKIFHKTNQKTRVWETLCGDMTGREFFRANAGGVAVFTFHTDHKNQEKGFNITFKFTEGDSVWDMDNCSSFANNTLKSPGYPNNYPKNVDCKWKVPIPQNMTMNISFTAFDLEYHYSCSFDYLTIKDDEDQTAGTYCGEKTGQNVYLTGNKVLITFHSDENVQERGFVIKFTAVPHVPPKITLDPAVQGVPGTQFWCSATGTPPIFTALVLMRTHAVLVNTTKTATSTLYEEGNYTCVSSSKYGTDVKEFVVKGSCQVIKNSLKSPGYPKNYPNNTDSTCLVLIPKGSRAMNVSFKEFNLEESKSCNRDYLMITNEKDRVFGKYCGNKTGQTVLVTGKYTLVEFHSDSSLQQKGFLLYFTAVPLEPSTLPRTTQTTIAVPEILYVQPTQENDIADKTMIYVVSAIAFILLLVLCCVLGFLCYRRLHHKRETRTPRSARDIIPLDKWELLPEQIEYEEELGRGAFGVVYKATLQRRVGIEVFDTSKRLEPQSQCKVVAVKVLQDDPSDEQNEEFLHEIEQMKLLGAHQNIVSLVGCCTLHEKKLLVIEYVPFGDLLQWLRRRRRSINRNQAAEGKDKDKCYDSKEVFKERTEISKRGQKKDDQEEVEEFEDEALAEQTSLMMESSASRDTSDVILDITLSPENLAENSTNPANQESTELLSWPSISQRKSNFDDMLLSTEKIDDDDDGADSFTSQQLFSFAWQIARGMNHLAEKDFIHRDLAARNILVGNDNRVKVSDFGLMRQIYEDVYSAKKTKKLPVKWMAPESIFDSIFTIKSDVWSFGILLWEMATMGGVPYPTLTNSELCRLLKTGYRMERPDMCCDEAYELMSECWREDPSTRPSFSELIERLEVIMTEDVPYCDVSKHDESSAYYKVPAKVDEHSV
ncbi:hypothetical protein ACROYT_G000954 [Oculina patagonica]